MDGKASNIVGMGFEGRDFLMCIVVERPQLEVVGASDKPLFTGDEMNASDGNIGDLKGFDHSTSLVVVNLHSAVVKPSEHPGFCGVKVY